MRIALAAAVAVAGAAAYADSGTDAVPRGFSPETAAAVGTRDLWVLGGQTLLRSTDAGKHFKRVGLPPFSAQGTVPTVVFANPRDGFSYVEDEAPLYVTHDGGESWHRAGPAGDVTAFAASGGFAYVVSGRHELERSRVGAKRMAEVDACRPARAVLAGRLSDQTSGSSGHRAIAQTSTRSRSRAITAAPSRC